jgi:hypothetical protein
MDFGPQVFIPSLPGARNWSISAGFFRSPRQQQRVMQPATHARVSDEHF